MKEFQKLTSLIDRYRNDLEFSLKISGLDSSSNNWKPVIISRNAYRGAGTLITFAARHLKYWDIFLQAIIAGSRRESMVLATMELICMTFEHVGELPPLGIIQHALNPKLLKAYCINLADWLEKYLQDAPDSTFQPPRLVLEYLQYKNTKGDTNEILECCGVFENVKEH